VACDRAELELQRYLCIRTSKRGIKRFKGIFASRLISLRRLPISGAYSIPESLLAWRKRKDRVNRTCTFRFFVPTSSLRNCGCLPILAGSPSRANCLWSPRWSTASLGRRVLSDLRRVKMNAIEQGNEVVVWVIPALCPECTAAQAQAICAPGMTAITAWGQHRNPRHQIQRLF